MSYCKTDKFLFIFNEKQYYPSDVLSALLALGITKGDVLFVHSDLTLFGKINPEIKKNEYVDAFINAFKEAVGSEGMVIIPCFSYSFCNGEIFDPLTTLSKVGILAERFRMLPDTTRTIDPIFSVGIWGKEQNYFKAIGTDCFGKNSIFEKIYEKNAKIIFIGPTFDMTYLHFIEQRYGGVPYRYMKKFSGQIKLDGALVDYMFNYSVRSRERTFRYALEDIAQFLDNEGVLKKVMLGCSKMRLVNAVDCYHKIIQGLKKDILFLLEKDCLKV